MPSPSVPGSAPAACQHDAPLVAIPDDLWLFRKLVCGTPVWPLLFNGRTLGAASSTGPGTWSCPGRTPMRGGRLPGVARDHDASDVWCC